VVTRAARGDATMAVTIQRRLVLLLALAGPLASPACGGKEPPPQLPTSGAQDRAASRVELVDLVIADGERAARVRELYVSIERLMLTTKQAQAKELRAVGAPTGPRSPEETRAMLRRFREAEQGALEKYVALQLELRRATTPEEFARLDAIK
jgi:hypothetical protein